MAHVLVVDDEKLVQTVLKNVLRTDGHDVTCAGSGEDACNLLDSQTFDLLMTDIRMGRMSGIELLRFAHHKFPQMPVIMLTGYATVTTAAEALKLAAFDYLRKPVSADDILLTVQRALECASYLQINEYIRDRSAIYRFDNIVAKSHEMQQLCQRIEHIAMTFSTVLICGESGSGRELIAKTIHKYGPRRDEVFLSLNCAELPEPILEMELFGPSDESMPVASGETKGLFERASGGTVFLDEIGVMPTSMQERLLPVLRAKLTGPDAEDDGDDATAADVQVLTAADTNLGSLVERGIFMSELFSCLSAVKIDIKPLRDRKEDILPLMAHLLRRELDNTNDLPVMTPDVPAMLTTYAWPGNVQELVNVVKEMASNVENGRITKNTLPQKIVAAAQAAGLDKSRDLGRGSYWARSLKAFLRDKIGTTSTA